jgi:hypothetical protein
MAGTLPLKRPPPDIANRVQDIVPVSPSALVRVSRHATGEPFFGRSGANRFDDSARRFDTCYLGFNLTVAFAESMLHDIEPDAAGFSVPATEVSFRFALRLKGKDLMLAKLYGTPLLRLGENGELSGASDYAIPQAWAGALVLHPKRIDGFIYISRRINDSLAVVLFERDPAKPLAIGLARQYRYPITSTTQQPSRHWRSH